MSNNLKCELFKNNKVVAVGFRERKLFKLMFKVIFEESLANYTNCESEVNLKIWHERLVHQNFDHVKTFLKSTRVNFKDTNDTFCEACVFSKHHRSHFKRSESRASQPGELVHSDICGPMQEVSVGGAKYFILFKDDYTNYRKVYFIKEKTEVCDYIRKFISEIKLETGYKLKILRSDNGLEFSNKDVQKLLGKYNVTHQKTVPYTPEHNGRAEREMRTLMEAARALMQNKRISKKLWAEAVNTASYVLNRTAKSSVEGKSPYELWFNKKPKISYFRTFGCDAYVHIPGQKRRKLDAKAKKGIFVGYCENTKGYRVWIPEERKIEISCDVIFREIPDRNEVTLSIKGHRESGNQESEKDSKEQEVTVNKESVEVLRKEMQSENEIEKVNEIRKETSQENLNQLTKIEQDDSDDDNEIFSSPMKQIIQCEPKTAGKHNLRPRKPISYSYLLEESHAFLAGSDEPTTYAEAMRSTESEFWKMAMDDEISSQIKNSTWELVEQPADAKVLDNKWVFKIKNDSGDNKSKRFKARLVVRGFHQKYGVDYLETFSPVVKFTSMRTMLTIAAMKNMILMQFDIKTAFLYGDLKEKIFMKQPEGYEDGTNKVCRLKRSLYGLKQASRCWNQKFSFFLKNFNFQTSKADPCIFSSIKGDKQLILALYIDDGLVAAEDKTDIEILLNYLRKEFEIKSSSAKCFLGIEINQKVDGSIFIHQTEYVRKVLQKFNMFSSKAVSTPADSSLQHSDDDDKIDFKYPYREAVGSLMYLAIATRPDLSFSLGVVSRYLDKPSKSNINAVKRIFKYLQGTQNYGIYISNKKPLSVNIFSDADYGGDICTRRSTSGIVICLGETPISWQSQRQKSVALSSTESEYIAAAEAVKELIWVKQLLTDHNLDTKHDTTLYMDNQSAILIIKNPEFHKRSKHIDIRYHFIREKFEDFFFKLQYVGSNDQLADIFTKPLCKEKFCKLRAKLKLKSVNS